MLDLAVVQVTAQAVQVGRHLICCHFSRGRVACCATASLQLPSAAAARVLVICVAAVCEHLSNLVVISKTPLAAHVEVARRDAEAIKVMLLLVS